MGGGCGWHSGSAGDSSQHWHYVVVEAGVPSGPWAVPPAHTYSPSSKGKARCFCGTQGLTATPEAPERVIKGHMRAWCLVLGQEDLGVTCAHELGIASGPHQVFLA